MRELSSSGSGSIRWDGKDTSGREVPAGVYLLKAVQDDRSGVTKVLRLK
ncbi:MAG TPA: FlgD immunoglobulin-like domain containing protein [Candidatus Cloacimonadota bacterium]|nr:FlgD immunoglobulin-like domain containing protein [Candidatus Cloacimonadota bacterium]